MAPAASPNPAPAHADEVKRAVTSLDNFIPQLFMGFARVFSARPKMYAHIWRMRLLGVLLVAIIVLVFLVEHGGV